MILLGNFNPIMFNVKAILFRDYSLYDHEETSKHKFIVIVIIKIFFEQNPYSYFFEPCYLLIEK